MIFVYKYVNKTSDHISILLLPHFILFNPILFNQDFVKADYILFTSTTVLWYVLVKVYFTSDFFSPFLTLLHLTG